MGPYYDDGQVTIYCADVRDVDPPGVAAAVVTSPPYNVGLAYDGHDDALPWPDYWRFAADAAEVMHRSLLP
jgi:DNA modification methylase